MWPAACPCLPLPELTCCLLRTAARAVQDVDLEDEDNVMASPGLLQFAVDAGLFDPSSGRPFNFFEVRAWAGAFCSCISLG